MTVVTTEAELLAEVGSTDVALAEAVLVIDPARNGWTVIVSETTALVARLGQVPKTVPALLLADPPALEVTEIKATPAGRGSVISRPVEVGGPHFGTPMVLVKLMPASTWLDEAV